MSSTDHAIPGTGFTLTGRYLLDASKYERRKRTDYIVVHCADTPVSMDIGVAEIRTWHVKERGWTDVGYHFVIRRNGNIERGRPAWAVGAGVVGSNGNTLHICLIGGKGGENFAPAQYDALFFLINTLQGTVKGPSGYGHTQVCGHRDFPGVDKTCPGFNAGQWFYDQLKSMAKNMGLA